MIEDVEQILRKIGLTGSEIKVYLGLLRIGLTTKTPLVQASGIAPSKIYEVIDKLIKKGLVSVIIKNNVRYFQAASPKRIKEYLQYKKEEINLAESRINEIMPELEELQKEKEEGARVSMFTGWEGFETVYIEEINRIKAGSIVYILGASVGYDITRTERFFSKYGKAAASKNIKVKVIFNETAYDYVKRIEKRIGIHYNKKFLFKKTPAEITIGEDVTLIAIIKREPIILRIQNKELAESFKQYFDVIWEHAKEKVLL